jgi:catechol 2,3-dioxygenase-like lactoylglutathione lyase family enzyme
MHITNIDHIVLTVENINATVQFYESVLGMSAETFGNGRFALKFGNQKINLHEQGKEFNPNAKQPLPGSGDLCFITNTNLDKAMDHVKNQGVHIIEGPLKRTGATGPIISFYFRDPDGNLIEVANTDISGKGSHYDPCKQI